MKSIWFKTLVKDCLHFKQSSLNSTIKMQSFSTISYLYSKIFQLFMSVNMSISIVQILLTLFIRLNFMVFHRNPTWYRIRLYLINCGSLTNERWFNQKSKSNSPIRDLIRWIVSRKDKLTYTFRIFFFSLSSKF